MGNFYYVVHDNFDEAETGCAGVIHITRVMHIYSGYTSGQHSIPTLVSIYLCFNARVILH